MIRFPHETERIYNRLGKQHYGSGGRNIIQLMQDRGSVTVRDIQRGCRLESAEQARRQLEQLAARGQAVKDTETAGNGQQVTRYRLT